MPFQLGCPKSTGRKRPRPTTTALNLEELVERYYEMKEDKDKEKEKSQMDDTWEMVHPKAIDSLNLPSNKDLKEMKDLCKTMGDLNESYLSMTSMEEQFKQKKVLVGLTNKPTIVWRVRPNLVISHMYWKTQGTLMP